MITTADRPVASTDTETISVSLKLKDDGYVRVMQDDESATALALDQGFPPGSDPAQSPTRMLAAAITLCLAASLQHCLRKGRTPIRELEASAVVTLARNDRGRLRVQRIDVLLDPRIDLDSAARLERCTALFENYCTVTESVRQGIDVHVMVAAN